MRTSKSNFGNASRAGFDRGPAVALLAAACMAGCGAEPAAERHPVLGEPSPEGRVYLLPGEPSDAQSVALARERAEDGSEVTVVGRIGGGKEPFVEGMAAFTIVDPGLAPCAPDCGCPTPWDYCCDPGKLPTRKALVEVVDSSGGTVATDARELLGLRELATVFARGTARKDQAGNLVVLATGLYVKP